MELIRYLQIVRKWTWLILLGTVLAGGAAFAVSSRLPPVYRGVTSMVVSNNDPRVSGYGAVVENTQLVMTYREVLVRRAVLEAAATNMNVAPSTARELMSGVTAWVIPDTTMIRVSVEHHDPVLAMRFANEVVAAFLQIQQQTTALQGADVSVVEYAALPAQQTGPRVRLNTLVAALGGLGLAVGMAFLLEYVSAASKAGDEMSA